MKITFVSGNREKLPDAVLPIGLLTVMEATPPGHERTLVDLCFEWEPEKALQDALLRDHPDLVALGMRNIQKADYSGLDDCLAYYEGLIAAVREVCGAPVVLGGSGFSVMPRELMARLRPDYGIAGEGEQVFADLVSALAEGGDPDQVPGLWRRRGGEVLAPPRPAPFLDLARALVPDRRLADPRYYERYGIDSVQTKRGCPLRCDYCTYPLIEGRVGRTRPPADVVDEMFGALEQQPGIRHFFVVDSVFNLPRSHAKDVCRELIQREWPLPWTCYANPLGFDAEMAALACRGGCAGMEVGSDSGVDAVLERLRKGFTTAQIRSLHELCEAEGIPDMHTFILGTQGETLDDVKRTLDFVFDLDPFSVMLMIWIDDYEALDPELRRTRRAFREEVEALVAERVVDVPHWVVPPLGINFDANLFRKLRRGGVHGPLWQNLRSPGPG